ncbi:hypothetical protein BTO07_06755 [Polaribacter sp. SA4-12]|nr:hypothetical protein BTO07_06755 [Polaribacter sp. SA4-12]
MALVPEVFTEEQYNCALCYLALGIIAYCKKVISYLDFNSPKKSKKQQNSFKYLKPLFTTDIFIDHILIDRF